MTQPTPDTLEQTQAIVDDLHRRRRLIETLNDLEGDEPGIEHLRAAWSAARGARVLPNIDRAELAAEIDRWAGRRRGESALYAWVINRGEIVSQWSVDLACTGYEIEIFIDSMQNVDSGMTVILQADFWGPRYRPHSEYQTMTMLQIAWDDYHRACAAFRAWVIR